MKFGKRHIKDCVGCLYHEQLAALCPRSDEALICEDGGIWEAIDAPKKAVVDPAYYMAMEYYDPPKGVDKYLTCVACFNINETTLPRKCIDLIEENDPTTDTTSKTLQVKLLTCTPLPHYRSKDHA